MSNTEDERDREAKALDALIASAFVEDDCDIDEMEIDRFSKALSDTDRIALEKALGPAFIESLFAGNPQKREKKVRGQLATAMNRSEDDQPLTDKAKEEMERKVAEAEKRRKEKEGKND